MPSRKIAKTLISLVVTLLLLEGLLRVTDLDLRIIGDPFAGFGRMLGFEKVDTVLQWRGRAGVAMDDPREVLNSRGYRSPEVWREKRPGVRRVAVLGDSCTFGVISMGGLRMDTPTPYPARLQEILDRNFGPGRFEVINYGMIGYTSWHGLRMLRREVLPDHPDVVVIRFGWNDGLGCHAGRSLTTTRHAWLERLEDLAYRSRLFSFLLYRGVPIVKPGSPPGPAFAHPVPWVMLNDYAWNLSRMIDLARAQGARSVLVDAPAAPVTPEIRANVTFIGYTRYRSVEDYLAAHDRYQEVTARVAREKGVPFLRTALGPGDFSPHNIAHPNAAGHERIARHLLGEIVSQVAREGAP